MSRNFVVVVLTCCLFLAMAALPAAADGRQPVDRSSFDVSWSEDPSAPALALCGVEVASELREWGHGTLLSDDSLRLHTNFLVEWSDSDTGEILLQERWTRNTVLAPTDVVIDEEDRTLTLTFEATLRGNTVRFMVPGQGVLLQQAGQVTMTETFVHDLDTGELVGFNRADPREMRGPHPYLENTDEENAAIVCGALTG